LILDIVGFFAGLVLVYRAGAHIEHMRWRTNHVVRLAYWAISIGGAALVFAPFSQYEGDWWLQDIGWSAVVVGVAVLFLFDRRDYAREREHERNDQKKGLKA
jgi:hypothetical protein